MSAVSLAIHGLSDAKSLGRSDLGGAFHGGDYERTSAEKSQQRALVAEFILSNFKETDWVFMLSMPGMFWFFEGLFSQAHWRTQFVGIERSETVFQRSLALMPNSHKSLATKRMPFGDGSYEYARTPAFPRHRNKYRNTGHSHRHLWMSTDAYVDAIAGNVDSTSDQRRKLRTKFAHRNAGWLDFTSGFCPVVDRTIEGLCAAFQTWRDSAPVVLTFMYGRDISGREIGRINHIHKLNRNFEPVKHWTYSGSNGTPMMTVCGLLHKPKGGAA